ncbi:SPOR domain-containing protein [Spiribacter halobius]|uniref:SPOR domain-containing protein n=1 Tax=Sediminicurvatus halobius TaxID=2182432 RepID=A0A2U2N703_9GAMM|nr:SPOR domain-containing protein [Spiribacter halobius]PWG64858.1 SPOR domain-containing protein [Spiribacter halobius]UEX78288.1 SPOR domain-containing protein [Spiribacter halobius]
MASRKRSSGQASKGRGGSGGALPGWVWGLSGLAVGLFIAFLVHLEGSRPADEARDPIGELLAPPEDGAGGGAADRAASGDTSGDDDGPRFEFYKLLPEQEVEVPQAPERTARTDDTPASAPPEPATGNADGSGERYLLQAGSFRNFDDADRLKATLALLGVEARIQEVELPGGETWHRVRIGPYSDREEINRVRERLAENEVEAILLRAGG